MNRRPETAFPVLATYTVPESGLAVPLVDAGLDPYQGERPDEPPVFVDLAVGQHYDNVAVDATAIAAQRRKKGYVHTEVVRPIRVTVDSHEALPPARYNRRDASPAVLCLDSPDSGDATAWAVARTLREQVVSPPDLDILPSLDATGQLMEVERRWQQLIHAQTPGFRALWRQQHAHERGEGLRAAWSASYLDFVGVLGTAGLAASSWATMPHNRVTVPLLGAISGLASISLLRTGSRALGVYNYAADNNRTWLQHGGPLARDARAAGTHYLAEVTEAMRAEPQQANNGLLVQLRMK